MVKEQARQSEFVKTKCKKHDIFAGSSVIKRPYVMARDSEFRAVGKMASWTNWTGSVISTQTLSHCQVDYSVISHILTMEQTNEPNDSAKIHGKIDCSMDVFAKFVDEDLQFQQQKHRKKKPEQLIQSSTNGARWKISGGA